MKAKRPIWRTDINKIGQHAMKDGQQKEERKKMKEEDEKMKMKEDDEKREMKR